MGFPTLTTTGAAQQQHFSNSPTAVAQQHPGVTLWSVTANVMSRVVCEVFTTTEDVNS